MKKICILFSLMIMLLCSGCELKREPLLEGTYVSYDEKNTEVFSDAKFTIKEITKEEYELANGENVFIDAASPYYKDEKIYLSIELYLYAIETEQYEFATLTELEFKDGTNQYYKGKINLKIKDNIYFKDDSAEFAFYFGNAKEVSVGLCDGNSKEFISYFRLQ